jgi:hypothetical protein
MKLTYSHTNSHLPSVSSRGFATDVVACSSAISDLPFTDGPTNLDHIVDEVANQNSDQSQYMIERIENEGAPDSDLEFTNATHNLRVDTREPSRSEGESLGQNINGGRRACEKLWDACDMFSNMRSDSSRRHATADHIKPALLDCQAAQTSPRSNTISASHVNFSYYPFLEMDFLSQLSSDSVNILESQQCFRIPTPGILDAFVREYFLHVHPNLPILNEAAFWDLYRLSGPVPPDGSRISLFVFRAMLFASCSVRRCNLES